MAAKVDIEELLEKFENALVDGSKSDAQRLEDKRIHRITNAYRTEICRIYRASGMCQYGDACRFAHSNEQLRSRQLPHNYKTKLCRNFEQFGFCIYGAKCLYIHRDSLRAFPSQLQPNAQMPSQFSFPRLSNSSPASAPFSLWKE
ncbi:hypothetical protein niasHT_001532 [Heterodera trifolii]|uniref:C3H1-type domain-containing protein n=1 Tax=Heterodera trifolii TaxID=157864 RepID=A0ABD2MAZ2_9BILA